MKKSSVLLLMLDSQDFSFREGFDTVLGFKSEKSEKKYQKILEQISQFEGSKILLFNKSDLLDENCVEFSEIKIEKKFGKLSEIGQSAFLINLVKNQLETEGKLKNLINKIMEEKLKKVEKISKKSEILFHKTRHLTIMRSICSKIDEFLDTKGILELDKRAEILKKSMKEVENLTGSVWNEEILDYIFKEFCLGK